MASNHVPSDHLPLQGQSIYTDPNYENLFPSLDQYGTPSSWNANHQLNHHQSGLVPQSQANPSWQHGSFAQQPYGMASFGQNNNSFSTASPYSYSQFNSHGPVGNNNHGSIGNYAHQQAVDPSLVDPVAVRQQQQSPYQMPVRNTPTPTPTPTGQTQTVPPQTILQNGSLPKPIQMQVPKSTTEMFAQRATAPPARSPYSVPPVTSAKYEVPKGKLANGFTVIDQNALAKSNQCLPLNSLVSFGVAPIVIATNRTSVLPQYTPRQSLSDLKKAGVNKKLLEKIAKSSAKSSASKIRKLSAGSPSSLKREVSSSEDETDSDDESDYSSDEEMETSPLPATRPEDPNESVRYDVIKAAWAPRRERLGEEKIRKSLHELWEVINTIHKRWRADSRAVSEAEERKKTSELPVLKSRVTSGRDLLQVALKATLEHAHPDVVYQMGKIKQFIYICYQFLANRFKMQDYNGPLPTVIYEVLVRCIDTLTSEVLEETKTSKALISMKKQANESNKALIQQIIDGAATTSKKMKSKSQSPPQEEQANSSAEKRPATAPPATRPTVDGQATKKLKASEPSQAPMKKAATVVGPKTPTTTSAATHKKPGEKPPVAPVKSRGNQVVNKPSSFFSTLNATSKKPTPATTATTAKTVTTPKSTTAPAKKPAPSAPAKPTFSFNETMAQLLKPKEEAATAPKPEKQLPPETPEEKTKRLRKESRRHLRVAFRPDAQLVSIRYFHHDPDEELGHDENFVRDAGDIGGEGRMFKQHRDMDIEEDDDEPEIEYRPWRKPSNVDFSHVEGRSSFYEPYGGGELKPKCPEKEANQRREDSTLMVFYSHPSDIPPTPREPLESPNEEETKIKEFGAPPQHILDRIPKSAIPVTNQFSSLFETFAKHAAQPQPTTSQSTYIPSAPPVTGTPDLSAIMNALQAVQQPAQPIQSAQPAAPTLPSVDLAAILSSIQQANAGGASFRPGPTTWPQFGQPYQQQPQQAISSYQQQQSHNQQPNGNSKRPREDGHEGQGSYKKANRGREHRAGPVPHKVIPCKFYKLGKCTKGDACTYIHED
ncbi:hypothetical protein CC78DRAFT_583102 [Lojkania enalia]|uniref:C3H1-type domain-containing protein n=1 Tax=Lojkania enalia TaxID=147567 RepID=A0A9P4K4K9_9PLEO|nr:hypothetical protein CC78DRAFT_583102 [Didymosphaeria enalia]